MDHPFILMGLVWTDKKLSSLGVCGIGKPKRFWVL